MPTGSVFMSSSKVTSSGQRKLFQFNVKTMTVAAIIGLRAKGSAILKKMRNAPAPSMIAASSSSRGKERKNWRKM